MNRLRYSNASSSLGRVMVHCPWYHLSSHDFIVTVSYVHQYLKIMSELEFVVSITFSISCPLTLEPTFLVDGALRWLSHSITQLYVLFHSPLIPEGGIMIVIKVSIRNLSSQPPNFLPFSLSLFRYYLSAWGEDIFNLLQEQKIVSSIPICRNLSPVFDSIPEKFLPELRPLSLQDFRVFCCKLQPGWSCCVVSFTGCEINLCHWQHLWVGCCSYTPDVVLEKTENTHYWHLRVINELWTSRIYLDYLVTCDNWIILRFDKLFSLDEWWRLMFVRWNIPGQNVLWLGLYYPLILQNLSQ